MQNNYKTGTWKMGNKSGCEKGRPFLLYLSSVCGVLSLQWYKARCSKAETIDNTIVKVPDEVLFFL